jgi:hypothetical protein
MSLNDLANVGQVIGDVETQLLNCSTPQLIHVGL